MSARDVVKHFAFAGRHVASLTLLVGLLLLAVAGRPASLFAADGSRPPNIVLIMTDDQGYGDLACHGNTQISTPALDRLHSESLRLTNLHVDPTCAPTRAALLTGRYSSRTGVWHTVMGRSLLRKDETTLAELLKSAGYRTGIFGKWHLGDNTPYRPEQRGFDESVVHGGGGVTQTPDHWGNDYFDDTYRHNGTLEKYDGYCTDVFFREAARFIEANRDRPFFAYIPTNAPHSPYYVDEKYSQPYRDAGIPSPRAEFYGMITNIDENVGRLLEWLRENELEENTIVIFLTDNGSAVGTREPGGFGAGMRGAKGSQYDGGHRVPCFIRWPAGGLSGGQDVQPLTAHVDLAPTLLELCGASSVRHLPFDGRSIVPLLKQAVSRNETPAPPWPARTLFVQSHRIEHPEPWRQSAVMTDRWRLVDGKQLFDMTSDPGQQQDVAGSHADVVAELRTAYEKHYADVSARFGEYCAIALGDARENPTTLTCHDWHTAMDQIPWDQPAVKRDPAANGFWAVDVTRPGNYEITLRSRPVELAERLGATSARIEIAGVKAASAVDKSAASVTFRIDLPAGETRLQAWLESEDRKARGAYFVDVRFVE